MRAVRALQVAEEPLRWHPRFCAHTTEQGETSLLEDGDVVWLEAGPAQRVAAVVNGREQAAALDEPAVASALDELMALELIVAAPAYARAAEGYRLPDFSAPPRQLGDGAVWMLAGFDDARAEAAWLEWGRALAAAHGGAVAIVDDELDPRLAIVEQTLLAARTPWLLCKPRGRRPSFGPWFVAGSGGACWSCLRLRMLANQPVRRWAEHAAGQSLAVPIANELLPPSRLPVALGGELRSGVLAGQLLQLERHSGAVLGAHHVAPRQHCPNCGQSLRAGARRPRPQDLKPAPRRLEADGGYRGHGASETFIKLSRHISRLTGVIADVSRLPGGGAEEVPVYRAAWLTCPLAAPSVRPPDVAGVALGKGRSPAQAQASALGEALERASAQHRGDEPCRFARADELDEAWLSPEVLRPLSAAQRAAHSIPAWRRDEPLHWIEADSLVSGRTVWLPLTACYAHTPFAREEALCRYTSNGCAAGRTLEEALLQGLLELVERDAVAIWWYNRLALPALPISLVGPRLAAALQRQLDREWQWWLLDATHDLATPVCVAVARRCSDGQFRFGFGCHLEAALAAQRAATELCQLIALGELRGKRFDFAAVASAPYLLPHEGAAAALSASTARDDLRDAVLLCVERLAARGLDVLAHRYPAFDDALVVIKAIAPGACHIWPQLGAARLTQVPVERGLLPRPLAEPELNPIPLFL